MHNAQTSQNLDVKRFVGFNLKEVKREMKGFAIYASG